MDRFGELPADVDHLSELMLLKTTMRDLRLRALESGPGRLVVTLGADALLDPSKVAALVQRSKGVYRLTPEMKLVAKRNSLEKPAFLLDEAKKILGDLSACALPEGAKA